MKAILCLLLVTFFVSRVIAQDENRELLLPNKEIQESDSGKFFLKIRNTNFLRNNEYFGPMVKGYTLLGYLFNPQVSYQMSPKTMITAGWSFLKYDGDQGIYQSEPTLSFQYEITPNVRLVLGTLYGTMEHKMIDPLLNSERYFTHHNENGIQFLFNYPRLRSDVWINWEAFEHQGSAFQEEFTQGTSTDLRLTPLSSKHCLSMAFQSTLCHKGGQIDSVNAPVQTLLNLGMGLKYNYQFSDRLSFGVHHYYCSFQNNSFPVTTPYAKGYGQYTQLWASGRRFDLVLGHWLGNGFISGRGDYFYSSKSLTVPVFLMRHTQMATGRFVYRKELARGIILGARLEGYYYFRRLLLDYSYSLYIVFNRDYLLSRRRP